MKNKSYIAALLLILSQCGLYTFSGSTLPGHMKTVDIPLFVNQSLQPDVAENLTTELSRQVLGSNLLRVVSAGGDATISGTVTNYLNNEYDIEIAGARDAKVNEYIVRISVTVEFMDNKKNEPIYKGSITGQGTYDSSTEKEQDGIERAVKDAVEQIMQKSIQSW